MVGCCAVQRRVLFQWTGIDHLVASIAPERLIGLTGSVFNVSGWLAGISTPIIVGYLAQHGFNLALSFVGVVTLCGVLSYVFLVGKVERIVGP